MTEVLKTYVIAKTWTEYVEVVVDAFTEGQALKGAKLAPLEERNRHTDYKVKVIDVWTKKNPSNPK